ncbi:hypothetical protein KFU94_63855 [Chloroflexi bacterium TSY]|nr:hypothetical protein [Chloroflexi bacterium TSY]
MSHQLPERPNEPADIGIEFARPIRPIEDIHESNAIPPAGCFVRARPRTISMNETYTYIAEVGETVDFRFEKAEGEFKIDFLYDGVLQRKPWKLRKFGEELLERSLLVQRLTDGLRWFLWACMDLQDSHVDRPGIVVARLLATNFGPRPERTRL